MNDYVFQEYPKWVTVDGVPVLCEDSKAENELTDATKQTEPASLRSQAEALGIVVDARWGDKRLQAEIDKAK